MIFIPLWLLLTLSAVALSYYLWRLAPLGGPLKALLKHISVWLTRLSDRIQIISVKLSSFDQSNDGGLFSDLTPDNDSDPDRIYDKRLLSGLRNANVKNIALTGPYGSGKSSILRTFQKRHPEFKYLNISLASFKEELSDSKENEVNRKGSEEPGASSSNMAELIELSILQQLFYYVKYKHIPGSRFKRIKKQSRGFIALKAIGIIASLCAIALLWKGNDLQKSDLLKGTAISVFLTNYAKPLLWWELLFSFGGLFILLFTVLRIYSNSKLHKLSLSSGEIEIAPSDSSILNKHLDEILYFFEVTKYNTVIFEDLDRFRNPDIFTKLREINILINNSLQINRKVVFIYALKDEVFTDEKRTKFFDLIIPVIPILTSLNSGDKLQQVIKNRGLSPQVSDGFLRDVGLYIDDMRLLKNVINEFLLYNDQFNDVDINKEKLFAMVLYKNIEPADFARLQYNQGVVADFFRDKPKMIDQVSEDIRHKIRDIDSLIQGLERSTQENINELRLTYIGALMTEIPDSLVGSVSLDRVEIRRKDLLSDENFYKLIQQSTIKYQYSQYSYLNEISQPFSKITNNFNPHLTYIEREALIKESREKGIEALKQEKEKLTTELRRIESCTIKQLVELRGQIYFQKRLEGNPLLSYLIRYGYIDEQFSKEI